MTEDPAVRRHLHEVVRRGRLNGPLDDLRTLIRDVWLVNCDRHDPKLGDDTQLLGLQCHRNILNRAKPLIRQIDEVEVAGAQTLEIGFGGKILHTSKVSSRDPLWDPGLIKWEDSDVRTRSAQANTQIYASNEENLFGRLPSGPLSPSSAKPEALTFLHLAWQGLGEGGTRIFIGFPQIGPYPWLAVMEIDNGRPGTGGVPLPSDLAPTSTPDHDTLAEPKVPLKRRASDLERSAQDADHS